MIINKRESAYFFIGMLNRIYVHYNLHSIKKKKGCPFFLPTTNETDDCGNQDNEQGNSPTNPNRRKNPSPRPSDDAAQFQDDEGNTKQSGETREMNVNVLIFHIISFLVCKSFLLFMYILYH